LLPQKYVKETTAYLDDFYGVLNNEKSRLREFGMPCSPEGKQNGEVIKRFHCFIYI